MKITGLRITVQVEIVGELYSAISRDVPGLITVGLTKKSAIQGVPEAVRELAAGQGRPVPDDWTIDVIVEGEDGEEAEA